MLTTEYLKELIEVLKGIREELIRIEEAIRDTALPRTTQINVRKNK